LFNEYDDKNYTYKAECNFLYEGVNLLYITLITNNETYILEYNLFIRELKHNKYSISDYII